ncbi:putative enoyl-(Acyl carrier protein) reductase [Lyophyllum shimeji]|uniref:Enoyl-(Acyl carrier protein) reductase n=1 Tax=Lyophyllum shimeji TaxID=47721 RepID=A0A9P3PM35_LYOSH|nr:putative enoyl-(Acyl carrier protein) reductase [Lyophyllum shimeji]
MEGALYSTAERLLSAPDLQDRLRRRDVRKRLQPWTVGTSLLRGVEGKWLRTGKKWAACRVTPEALRTLGEEHIGNVPRRDTGTSGQHWDGTRTPTCPPHAITPFGPPPKFNVKQVLYDHASRLKDTVVVITGAANGIGRETALQLASHGAKVVIGDLDVAGAEKTVRDIENAGGTAVSMKCNVTVWDDQVAMFELALSKFGAVDVVVPNAGVSELGQFTKVTFKDGKPVKPDTRTLDVNLTGVTYSAYLAQHYLRVNRDLNSTTLKALVLIGSVASWTGIPRAPMYTASKHAVLGIMRSLYPEFHLRNIRIACIHPFFADTAIVPTPIKVFLAGIPLASIPRIAGSIIHAATDPDPDTNGSAFLLNDDGPVFRVPREEFKMGVYKMIDDRANALLKGATGARYYARVLRDLVRVFRRPMLVAALGVAAAKMVWEYRELILGYIQKYVSL